VPDWEQRTFKGKNRIMSRVYVVNAAGHNHHLAKPYGELRPITEGYVSQGSLDRVLYDVIKGIHDSTPEDYLLLSGLMILNALAASAWLSRHGKLKLLVWDRRAEKQNRPRYRPFITTSDHINELWTQIDEWAKGSGSSQSG
jgi:hypothetical protein